jgi:hypothetical protein
MIGLRDMASVDLRNENLADDLAAQSDRTKFAGNFDGSPGSPIARPPNPGTRRQSSSWA